MEPPPPPTQQIDAHALSNTYDVDNTHSPSPPPLINMTLTH
jgi:hypothetical protein